MPLQDLTPQLRTRLSRVERIVGVFIFVATLVMIGGLGFYLYQTAKSRGWFLLKAPYYIYLRSGNGLKAGDPVLMMGFPVGKITKVEAMPPLTPQDVVVEFVVLGEKNVGYVWTDSKVNVKSAGLLGNRYLEVVKGDASGKHGKVEATYRVKDGNTLTGIWDPESKTHKPFYSTNHFELKANEPPDLSSHLDSMVQEAKDALPHILALTNLLTRVMSNTAEATDKLNRLLNDAQPVVSNLELITRNLKNPEGSLGDWLLPTNLHAQVDQAVVSANQAMLSANAALTNANAQISEVAASLDQALENLAGITGNLRLQVDRNTNVVGGVSKLIIDTDDMVQGLKRHWLLRSAFRNKGGSTNSAPLRPRAGRGGR